MVRNDVGTMEGFSGKKDCSSEDMAIWLFASQDELDIVGEATMDGIAKKDHMGLPSSPIPFYPIVKLAGFSKASWINLDVIFVNNNGVAVAEGICCNIHPQDCIDENPLGT